MDQKPKFNYVYIKYEIYIFNIKISNYKYKKLC